MMELIIDIGNTNQKAAVFDGGILIRMVQYPLLTPRDIEMILDEFPAIASAIMSSVLPDDVPLIAFLTSHVRLVCFDEHTPVPVVNCYQTPATLGKDRLAAAVAGHARFPDSDVLVINAGTCLTFDFIDAKGRYHGGAISPGMRMRFRSLHTFTGKLPLIDMDEPVELTGTDTPSSIRSGVVNGMVTEIEGIASRYMERYPGVKTVLSGGDLNHFDKRLKISTFAIPNIVIHGLQKILAFNVS